MDYLLIDGKYYKSRWQGNSEGVLQEISKLSSLASLIWCDQSDSSGTLLGDVVPLVYKYAKSQLLVDRGEYLREHYGARLYCDYYYRKFGVRDPAVYLSQPISDPSELSKLVLSWNSGLMHYGMLRPYFMFLYKYFSHRSVLHFSKWFTRPSGDRPIDFSCRMGIPYSRETVSFQRKKIKSLLDGKLPTDKLTRYAYLKEMRQSNLTVSPFGYGEITLKDFECFLAGSALVKADMSVLNTWPPLYVKGSTYAAHNWDCTDLVDVIEELLGDKSQAQEIAENGQQVYYKYTVSRDAPDLFARQFMELLR
ncbi:hypothetical protein [Owenweeksia hongkongensis]|uniref:hypothetical protein n=1 Tax=Owenweeksia hongkongensis TaxID=253245 RepID=UPI003A923FD1